MVDLTSDRARIRATLINSGKYSFDEADEKLSRAEVAISIEPDVAETPAGQAAFLTAAVTAVRCFGSVMVSGELDVPLLVAPPGFGSTLLEAARHLGARIESGERRRNILIGVPARSPSQWAVQTFWKRWIAGVTPSNLAEPIEDGSVALAGVAAGAEAVAQAFAAEQGDVRAGRSRSAVSLWSPGGSAMLREQIGPSDYVLPKGLWLIGLGNLGQAFVWSMTVLPYADWRSVTVFLQDDDILDRENWGTSVLVPRGKYGRLKTQIAESWLQSLGAKVRRIDRRADEHLRRSPLEPALALAGLDNMPARRTLGDVGFEYVVDVGLGATHSDYRQFRINVFDQRHDPRRHFAGVEDRTEDRVQRLLDLPAYSKLLHESDDGGCGLALLAGKSVAAPFVSSLTGALTLAQAVRISSGDVPSPTITGAAGSLGDLRVTHT
jgi:hypothetical protein